MRQSATMRLGTVVLVAACSTPAGDGGGASFPPQQGVATDYDADGIGAAWVEIPRESYNYFLVAGGVGPSPFQVRTTAIDGQQLVDTLPAPQSGVVVPGSGQFH